MKKIIGIFLLLIFLAGVVNAFPPTPPPGTAGTGDITKVGTPVNHQWPYWTGDGTLAGVSITASKPICSDASSDPVICTYAPIVALWAAGACSGYLKNDGTCDAGGSGDVTGVGDCANGACLDGTSDGGTYIRLYDGTSAYVGITAGVRTLTFAPSNANAENMVVTFGDNNNTVAISSGTGAVVNVTGNAATATALAANPADCGAGTMATAIAASGALTCGESWASPSAAIGTGTPVAGTFTTVTAASYVSSAADGSHYLLGYNTAANPTCDGTTEGALASVGSTPVAQICKDTNWVNLAEVSGALGTPSFTALNMPSSDADPGTTAGQIRHDSTDTGSNSGGTAKWYDGAQVRSVVDTGTNYTILVKTEFLPIGWAVDGTTAPSALAVVTGKEINARSFTEGDDVVFWWIVPNDYVGGVKYRVFYALSANASADETVVYSMTGCIAANSGDLDCAAGTALTIADELGTDDDQYQVMISDYSAESNADWSLAAGGLARLAFSNAAAGDLATGEPLVIGIEIKYKAKIIGIAGY